MHDSQPLWRLDRFLERLDAWIEQEKPPGDLLLIVLPWIMSRAENPYRGVRREMEDYWFGEVPDTDDGSGRVVVCSYWVDESRRVVVCDMFATLSRPV